MAAAPPLAMPADGPANAAFGGHIGSVMAELALGEAS
jgi:hypothetical protein